MKKWNFTILLLLFTIMVFCVCKNNENNDNYICCGHKDETWQEYIERISKGSIVFGDFLYQHLQDDFGDINRLIITRYTGMDGNVTIPGEIDGMPVTTIGMCAFRETKLTKVIIPDSITGIRPAAFYDNDLTEVIFSNNLTYILESAFNKNRLTSITLPESVVQVSHQAFTNNQLTNITIGANVIWTYISPPFDDGFREVYYAGGRLAGTYTRPDPSSTVWTKQ